MTDQITGGEAAYRILKANGIDTVFGLLGGSKLELYDAIVPRRRHCLCRRP